MSTNFVPTNQEIWNNAVEILDTTTATSTSASFMVNGGITIFSTQSAYNFNSGGSLLVLGGTAIQGNVIIGGITQLLSTITATNTSTGALTIAGGLSVQGSVYGIYSNFNYIQANIGASIPNIISSNISVGNLSAINITCQNLYSTNSITASNLIVTNISTNSLYINSTASGNIPTIFGYNSNNTTATGLAFSSWNGNQFTEKFRFDSIGNFLINTTQPTNSNTLYLNSLSTTGSDGATFDTQYAINPVISLAVQGSKKYTIGIDSNDAYKLKFNRGLFSSQFNTVTLDQNGNVGINTATPTSKLQVIGDTNISGNITAGISFYTPSATIGSLNLNNLSLSNLTSGSAYFTSTTISTNINTGAVVINGGLGVTGAANIGGNLSIAGNLSVSGTTITINTTNVSIQDNFLGLNYQPTGQADTGLILARYQIANNSGSGDVVNDTVAFSGTIVAGSTTTSIMTTGLNLSTVTGFYIGYWVKITSGLDINQVRQIIAYNGTTKTLTLASPLINTPSVGDSLNLYGNVYALNYFNYSTNQFILGYSSVTFGSFVPSITNYANLYLNNLSSTLVTTTNLQATNATITNLNLQSLSITNLTVSNLFSTNNSFTNIISTNSSISNQYVTNNTVTNQTVSNLNSIFNTLGNANVNIITVGNLNVTGISNLLGGLVQSINQTGTNATISNIINTNTTTSNLFGTNATITNLINTNGIISTLTTGTLNISSGLITVNNINNISLTTTNLLATTQISTLNLISTNNTLSNIVYNNITGTNSIITNITSSSLLSTNGLFSNITVTNSILTLATSNNIYINNATANNILLINSTATNILVTNISASTLSLVNLNLVNITATNSLLTNNTTTNSIITNLSAGTISLVNSSVTNFTTVNSKITNETIGTINMTNLVGINSTITNSIGINLNYTNISVSSLNVPNLTINNLSIGNLVATNMTAVTFLLTGTTNASNIAYIDCQNSQVYPGQLVFKNSYGTGDFRIYGDGGDVQWQGGGGRSLQLGAYHEIRLTGGRVSTLPITFITGSTSTWNTIIQNLNNSIGLVVQGVSGQSVDLTQWSNNFGTVLSRIDYIGNLQITSTSDTVSSITGGSITTSGGISVAKAINIGSTQIATNNSSGGLIVSGGAGFNGDIYSNNFYTYQGTSTASVSLTPSPLTTKGDIYTYATSGSRLPAGSYGQILTSNTTSNTGLQWVSPMNITGIYGSEYNYVSSLTTSGTTSILGSLKTSLTTGTLLGGTYKIELNYSISPNTSLNQNSEIAVYINTNSINGFNTGTTTSNLIHQCVYRPVQITNLLPISQSIVLTQGNNILTIGMYYRNQGNKETTNIGNASIIFYRIQ